MSVSGAGGGVLFSKYIDDNILTPLLCRLQVITDDERFRCTDLLEVLDGIRDLRAGFAGMAKKERFLVHLFDPIERLVDDVLESDADASTLQPKLHGVRQQIGVINKAIAESSYSMISQRGEQPSSSGSRGRGGPGGGPAPVAELIYYGGEHLRRAVQGMDMRLRHCLLCLAAFPEGAVVKKRLLIHWWMGEGFVESATKGKERFQQLVGMRFVSAVRRGHCDTAHECTVHPWIRRMLVSIARASAFLSSIADDDGFSWARRACLRNGGEKRQAALVRFHPEVRTIYNVDHKYVKLGDAWFSNKARLGTMQLGQWRASGASEQVADPMRSHVELIGVEHLDRGVGACRSLRYLSLRGISRIEAIPDAIGKLGDLVVLDLRACHDLQALTKEVTKLHRLQYLDVSECYLLVDMPEGLGKLSRLQVLKGFVLASSRRRNACSLRELAGLRELRKLSIVIGKKLNRAEVELGLLSKLTSLTSLKITWGTVSSQEKSSDDASHRALGGFALPSELSKLELCCFPCQELAELVRPDGLQRLKKLYVTGGMLRDLGPRSDNGDCRVEVLRLRRLNQFKCDWEQLHEHYKQLKFVEAHTCPCIEDEADRWPLNDRGLWWKSDQQQAGPGGASPQTETVGDESN